MYSNYADCSWLLVVLLLQIHTVFWYSIINEEIIPFMGISYWLLFFMKLSFSSFYVKRITKFPFYTSFTTASCRWAFGLALDSHQEVTPFFWNYQHICAHHYVFLLHVKCYGANVQKVYNVEKISYSNSIGTKKTARPAP